MKHQLKVRVCHRYKSEDFLYREFSIHWYFQTTAPQRLHYDSRHLWCQHALDDTLQLYAHDKQDIFSNYFWTWLRSDEEDRTCMHCVLMRWHICHWTTEQHQRMIAHHVLSSCFRWTCFFHYSFWTSQQLDIRDFPFWRSLYGRSPRFQYEQALRDFRSQGQQNLFA